MIEKLLAPPGRSPVALAKQTGICASTFYRWLREAKPALLANGSGSGADTGHSDWGRDSVAFVSKGPKHTTKKSEKWTLREKMRVVMAAEGLSEEEIGALVRRERIHLKDLEEWRRL